MITANLVHELWCYRNLIVRLAWSGFKLRYKSTALGFLWSLLEPMLMLLVLYAVFSNFMRIQVKHYQLFLLMGIILWNFLDRGTSMSIWSIVGKPSLVQKVYFPRDILGLSMALSALNVYFRDVQFIWRLVLQVGFFAMIITMMRDCTLYRIPPAPHDLTYIALFAIGALLLGYLIFDRLEPRFAEVI